MVRYAPNLKRLKLKLCRLLGQSAVKAISKLEHLEHLSLILNKEVSTPTLVDLVTQRGPSLRTLSLEKFIDADDSVLEAIHTSCTQISKLRFSENDTATDAGDRALFANWAKPPLTFVDVNSTRDVDNNNAHGPEEPAGLRAMMAHSGTQLKFVDISPCRHI